MSKSNLELWQKRYENEVSAYNEELSRMDYREELYRGTKRIKSKDGSEGERALHVRNIVAEMIESQVQSTVPWPKVSAIREEDEPKAIAIENLLRNEIDRISFEVLNDMSERTTTIQGGDLFLAEWDTTQRTHTTIGALAITELHPKKVIPQDGVYEIEDMDWIFVDLPVTKAYIKRRYDVDVADQAEEKPEGRSLEGDSADELVTLHVAYYRNDNGGIGRYAWVVDTECEDREDCLARDEYICDECGLPGDGEKCIYCGGEDFTRQRAKEMTLVEDLVRSDGSTIPAYHQVMPEEAEELGDIGEEISDEPETTSTDLLEIEPEEEPPAGGSTGKPELTEEELGLPEEDEEPEAGISERDGDVLTELGLDLPGDVGIIPSPAPEPILEQTVIPYYTPDIYPIILRRNVSCYGQLLGGSDVDMIADQQNTVKMVETQLIEKLLKGGSVITMPSSVDIETTDAAAKLVRIENPAQAQMITAINLQPDIGQDMAYMALLYEEPRQIIGITDAFQGRKDTTATSGVAKEFAAQQSAGRFESKRVMKNHFYSKLYEVMFKLTLANVDEARPVIKHDTKGNTKFDAFNPWDFLEQDDAGEWFWNTDFLFSVDESSGMAANRQSMWQETRMNFQGGAYGDPTQLDTLIAFWTRMEEQHYPSAGATRKYFQEKLDAQQAAQKLAAMDAMGDSASAQQLPGMGTAQGAPGAPAPTGGAGVQAAPQAVSPAQLPTGGQALPISGGGEQ